MPVVHHASRTIHLKIVYYGPGLGGKTTNLRWIYDHSRPDLRGRMVSLDSEAERTIFFDLLPIDLGQFKGYAIRLHLCTVPGQIMYQDTRRMILRHVDGVVFVVDSQSAALDQNYQSITNLEDNLRSQGDDPGTLPLVVQYNKRDLPDVMPIAELRRALFVPNEVPQIEANARDGVGVFETLKAVTKACLNLVAEPNRLSEGRSPSILPGRRASMYPKDRPSVTPSSTRIPRPPALPKVDD